MVLCLLALSLSKYEIILSTMLGTIPSLVINFLVQTVFFVVSEEAMHLASIVESVVMSYLIIFQLTPSFRVIIFVDLDLLSSLSNENWHLYILDGLVSFFHRLRHIFIDWKLASIYPWLLQFVSWNSKESFWCLA